LRSGVDVITLTSPSTVENFFAIATGNGLDPLSLPNRPVFACIGPITESAAKEVGLPSVVVAEEYTTEGLVAVLKDMEVL
jgi:uroporphyrinogen-III synthase